MSTLKVDAIRHNSATSDAITTAADGTCTAKITGMTGGGGLSHRNVIINGAAQVNQRGNQTSVTSTTYSVDRFRFAVSAGGTWSLSQSTDSPDGFSNSVKLDCTTAAANPGLAIIQQRIEGHNVQAFAKGTSSAKQFAVSFYVKTNKSGVYTVELKDDDNSRTVSKTFTVSDANWNRYTLIFPADTTGAFDNDSNGSLYLSIWLAVTANSAYTNGTFSDGTWAALVNGNRVSNSNVNLADSTSNEFLLTGVQVEVGDTVTSFEHRSIGDELARCQRYFYQYVDASLYGSGIAPLCVVIGYQNNNAFGTTEFPVTMRSTPSLVHVEGTGFFKILRNAGTGDLNALALHNIGRNSAAINAYNASSGTSIAQDQVGLMQTNDTSCRLGFNAEL